ncbi:aldo/keto reductase [Nakamurella deserti]|uniref:aldo/keto reductase n=1 Tax=Nakamurella deserti TaxID=2164074 RepID=UPI000DBE0EF6|nr:aldo/keto reductase [Nakamurella deserti]
MDLETSYRADPNRYEQQPYRRTGRSGLLLPVISLGLWHNFGADHNRITAQAILRRAFDLGVTHFDLANNYGPPYGSAESLFGDIYRRDFRRHRDEIVISTKAGYDMWPGPYGDHGSRKYLMASLDQSLTRMGVEYVDIYYHHRPDPDTPIEETMGALASIVDQGKALYVAVSNYNAEQTRAAHAVLAAHGTPLLMHQMRYSMLSRGPEEALFGAIDALSIGGIAFSPLAQGLLTDRYRDGIPAGSRAAGNSPFLQGQAITPELQQTLRRLSDIAAQREQTLAQMAISWILRRPTITSALVGASSPEQLTLTHAASRHLDFEQAELDAIDVALTPVR